MLMTVVYLLAERYIGLALYLLLQHMQCMACSQKKKNPKKDPDEEDPEKEKPEPSQPDE